MSAIVCLIAVLVVWGTTMAAERSMLPAPPGYPTTMINGQAYVRGRLYVARGFSADSLLKPWGVRELQFDQSTAQFAKYKALWPAALNLDSLPPAVVGVDYEELAKTPLSVRLRDAIVIVTGGSFAANPAVDRYGNVRVAGYRKFMQVIPPEPDTTVQGRPYARGWVYLSDECDTAQFGVLGFTPLGSAEPLISEPTIADLIAHPECVDQMRLLPATPVIYRTAWPMNTRFSRLSDCVFNAISEFHARKGSLDGKPHISFRAYEFEYRYR